MPMNASNFVVSRVVNTSKKILKKACLKFLSLNSKILVNKKLRFLILKNKLLFLTIKTIKKRRCLLTGRGRGVYKRYGLSRLILRGFLNLGLISGFKKV